MLSSDVCWILKTNELNLCSNCCKIQDTVWIFDIENVFRCFFGPNYPTIPTTVENENWWIYKINFLTCSHDGILGGLLCMYNLLPAESQTPPESPVNWLWPKPINKDRGVFLGSWMMGQCKTSVNAIRNGIFNLVLCISFVQYFQVSEYREFNMGFKEKLQTMIKAIENSSCHT